MTQNYGLKISRPGFDVSDPNPKHHIFDSSLNTFNVAVSGSISHTQNGGSHTFTIAHGRPFIPYALVFHNTDKYPDDWVLDPTSGVDNDNGDKTDISQTRIQVDATNLSVLVFYGNGSSETITLRYFIFNVPVTS